MQMLSAQLRESTIFVDAQDCPSPSMLVLEAVYISIGRLHINWTQEHGLDMRMDSKVYVREKVWMRGQKELLIWRRYYALREPTTAKAD